MISSPTVWLYSPTVCVSKDYDAPLTESGDITDKYLKTRELLMKHVYKPLGNHTLTVNYFPYCDEAFVRF